jgi:hypothetical protein
MKYYRQIILSSAIIISACVQISPTPTVVKFSLSDSTLTPSVIFTPTKSPTLSSSALATAWSTAAPVPTVPLGFPTPYPPTYSELDPFVNPNHYFYGRETIIAGDYIITRWNYIRPPDAYTITGKNNERLVIEGYYLELGHFVSEPPSSTDTLLWLRDKYLPAPEIADINDDGIDEALVIVSSGGNNCFHELHLYTLGEKIIPLFAQENYRYCGYYWFKDLDQDGMFELIAEQPFLGGFEFNYWIIDSGFYTIPEILKYKKDVGYVPAMCLFKDFYINRIASIEKSSTPDYINSLDKNLYNAQFSELAVLYMLSGESEKSNDIVVKYFHDEELTDARRQLNAIRENIKSSYCPQ